MGEEVQSRVRRRGQSLVELALVLPVLIILLLGLADLGRLFYAYVGISGAAAEGAAYGATIARRPDLDFVEETRRRTVEATDGLVQLDDPAQQVTVVPASINPSTERITVTVTYDFELITPLVRNMLGGGILPLRGLAARSIVIP